MRNPEALLDVTLQPIIFIAAVHLHLRRRDRRRLAARLPAVPAPRHPRPDDRLRRRRDRRQPQHRHREGRLRPLPQPADRARRAADRRRARRRRPLRAAVVITLGFGYVLGFRAETDVARGARRVPAGDRLRAVPVLDLGLRRHARPHARRRAGHPVPRRCSRSRSARARSSRPTRCRAGCSRSPRSTRSRIWSAPCAALLLGGPMAAARALDARLDGRAAGRLRPARATRLRRRA